MENPELTISESWAILGYDASIIVSKLKEIHDPLARVMAAEKALVKAKAVGRKLQGKFHPDINKAAGAKDQFLQIGKAMESLEKHTAMMRSKLAILTIKSGKEKISIL